MFAMDIERNRTTDRLLGKMWKTKSARFNAHRRLVRKNSLSTWATSILAVYIIIASLAPLAYPGLAAGTTGKLIQVLSVAISIFLIIIILLENSKNYLGEADRMLRCALAISEVYNRFQALTPAEANTKRAEFTDEYNKILEMHELNHNDIDFRKFELQNSRELRFGNWKYIGAFGRYAVLWLVEYWLYIILVGLPPIAAVFFWYPVCL
jgi:hypothetical protein